jgi:hypothetical protein
MANPTSSKSQARIWRQYYLSNPHLSAADVAAHFGVNLSTLSSAWRRYGLTGRPATIPPHELQELQDDPYPTAIESVAAILATAISQDACGGSEPAILGKMYAAMYKVLADEDPASLHLLAQP